MVLRVQEVNFHFRVHNLFTLESTILEVVKSLRLGFGWGRKFSDSERDRNLETSPLPGLKRGIRTVATVYP